tara:strand:- start:333 stop:752 length:420 start_codon:yes stop_codon:yes gene_type:complete
MNLTELLVGLTTHYNALIRSTASQLHLTASQAFHLISIPHDGIPLSKLAHKLGLDASTLTRNIQKLENLGLIKRKHDSYDKRVQKAVLTKRGLEITKKIEIILLKMNNSITDQIDLDTQENMYELLEKLVWSMDCAREK